MNKFCVFILFLFISCNISDDNINEYTLVPIESAEILTNIVLNEKCMFEVKYKRTDDCLFFDDFNIQTIENITYVSVKALKINSNNCNVLPEEEITTVYFEYIPTESKTYHFKFWKGLGVNGEDVYVDYEFEVN